MWYQYCSVAGLHFWGTEAWIDMEVPLQPTTMDLSIQLPKCRLWLDSGELNKPMQLGTNFISFILDMPLIQLVSIFHIYHIPNWIKICREAKIGPICREAKIGPICREAKIKSIYAESKQRSIYTESKHRSIYAEPKSKLFTFCICVFVSFSLSQTCY